MSENRSDENQKGMLFIISAPSGAGKTTLCNALRKRFPELDYSISHTTRAPRKNEVDGRDYYFISEEEFKEKRNRGEWAEWAKVHGHYYGTCAKALNAALDAGKSILLDIDVEGARQIKSVYPKSTAIFIMPPSMKILEERLRSRETDSEEDIVNRTRHARKEIASKHFYDHVIVNDRLEDGIEDLCSLIGEYMAENNQS